MRDKTYTPTKERPAICERCGLNYRVDDANDPITIEPYTCDDCGGYVEAV